MDAKGDWRDCSKTVNGIKVSTRCREYETENSVLQVEAGTTGYLHEQDGKSCSYFRLVNLEGKYQFIPVMYEGLCVGFVMMSLDADSSQNLDFALRFASDTFYEQNVGIPRDRVTSAITKAILLRKPGEIPTVSLDSSSD